MSLHEYLKTRQAALEEAYSRLRAKTCSPYTAKVRDLCALLVVREELRNISEALGERNPDAAWERFAPLDRQRVAAERKVQP